MAQDDNSTTLRRAFRSRVVHAIAGLFLLLLALFADPILGRTWEWGMAQTLILFAATCFFAAACLTGPKIVVRVTHIVAAGTICLCIALVLGEVFCRLVGFDFSREQEAWLRVPVYYRQPMHPQGEVFFRRAGPIEWTGRVLSTRMAQLGITPNPYEDEAAITIRYDRDGFRNLERSSGWTIAIVGDSFTELGHLPHEALFTSVIEQELGTGVRNLGASYTGPLSHLSYLREYGRSPGLRDIVVVFFEGNDLGDLQREVKALEHWNETGIRETREFRSQTSMLRGLYQLLAGLRSARYIDESPDHVDAYFRTGTEKIPVTLGYVPPPPPTPNSMHVSRLTQFLDGFAEMRDTFGVKAWLVFMPCKRRVLHSQVWFRPSAPRSLVAWEPRGFPSVLEGLCEERALKFLDLTPTLMSETRRQGKMLYNTMWDSHLTGDGSRLVGRTIAGQIRASREGVAYREGQGNQ